MATVKLGDIAIEAKSSNKGDKTGIRIVGLEHLTPSNVTLSSWSDDTENSFTKEFSKGDVLFGRRRAYLKKAAVAPFDGICSGDITVIRAIEDKIDPDLLPFIIHNDFLFDFAVGKSAGSLSPRVKWTHLKEFTIDIPSMPEQSKLAETLWSINETKNAYEKLINKTDELVKSQFIEMFGDPQTNDKDLPVMHINEVVSLLRNGATIKQNKDREGYPITRIETIANRTVDRSRMGYAGITDLSKYEDYILQDGDILMSHINSVTHMGKSAIYERSADENIIHGMNLLCLRPKVNIVMPYFLYRYFQMDYFYDQVLSITKKAVNQASMTIKDLGNLTLIVPDMESQMLYVDFVRQSDKSKFALQEAIKDLDALSKKIIAENLIPVGKE